VSGKRIYLFKLNGSERLSLLDDDPHSEKLGYQHNARVTPTIWCWWGWGRGWWWWWRDRGWGYCCCSLGYTGDEFIWQFSLVCLVLHLFLEKNTKLKMSIGSQHRYLKAPAIIDML